MVQKMKKYLDEHEKQYEMIRYIFAGGLTTLLSMVVHYGFCFLMAEKAPYDGNLIPWLVDSINRANNVQMSGASAISWVIAVLFA